MTRFHYFFYYFAAWLIGGLTTSVLVWVWLRATETSGNDWFGISKPSGLLVIVLAGLALAPFTAILFAFLLRRIMTAVKCRTPWHWAIAGAVLAPAVIAAIGFIGVLVNDPRVPKMTLMIVLTFGPQLALAFGWWLAIPAGALTAYLLYLVDRRLARRVRELVCEDAAD